MIGFVRKCFVNEFLLVSFGGFFVKKNVIFMLKCRVGDLLWLRYKYFIFKMDVEFFEWWWFVIGINLMGKL